MDLLPQDFFPNESKYSFDEIPGIKKQLEKYVEVIEAAFETEFSSLKIEATFVDERTLFKGISPPDSYGDYRSLLESAVRNDSGQALSIFILPIANLRLIHPLEWNLYSLPVIFAHETAHLLGVDREGYCRDGYPPVGLMNDGYAFRLLRQMAPHLFDRIKLLPSDFREIIYEGGWGPTRTWKPAVKSADLKDYFDRPQWTQDLLPEWKTGDSRADCLSQSEEAILRIQKKALMTYLRWLDSLTP